MPNCYLQILAPDRPFEIDVDENGRTEFSLNLDASAVWPSDSFEEDLVRICQNAGVPLVLVENTFIGAAATIPTGDGPYVLFISQPGFGTLETHDGEKLEQPGVQIMVRGKPSTAARVMAFSIFRALDGVRNLEVA